MVAFDTEYTRMLGFYTLDARALTLETDFGHLRVHVAPPRAGADFGDFATWLPQVHASRSSVSLARDGG
jgi:hypothetical protein